MLITIFTPCCFAMPQVHIVQIEAVRIRVEFHRNFVFGGGFEDGVISNG